MTALAWTVATVSFALWLIEHFGGTDSRARLRHQRDLARKQHRDAEARACGLGIRLLLTTVERDNARRLVHPSGRLAPVASVTPIRKGVEL